MNFASTIHLIYYSFKNSIFRRNLKIFKVMIDDVTGAKIWVYWKFFLNIDNPEKLQQKRSFMIFAYLWNWRSYSALRFSIRHLLSSSILQLGRNSVLPFLLYCLITIDVNGKKFLKNPKNFPVSSKREKHCFLKTPMYNVHVYRFYFMNVILLMRYFL